jgi:hypothetical protein
VDPTAAGADMLADGGARYSNQELLALIADASATRKAFPVVSRDHRTEEVP